jgi:putative transposase
VLAAQLGHRHTAFSLAQDRKDLGFAKSRHLHQILLRYLAEKILRPHPLSFGEDYQTVWRHAYVTAFLQLYRDGEVFRTPDSVPKALPKLESHVNDLARATQSNWKNPRAGRKNEFRDPPCAKSLLTWVKRYEDGGYSALALVPRTHRSGNRKARFCPQSRRILGTAIEAYLTRRRLNKREVFDEFKKLIDNANEQLLAANQLPLKVESRRGVERAIGSLDPYFTYVQRHGVDAASRKFALYEKGVDASYPMERIEIDEWKVDLISIFETSGLLDFMDADQLTSWQA